MADAVEKKYEEIVALQSASQFTDLKSELFELREGYEETSKQLNISESKVSKYFSRNVRRKEDRHLKSIKKCKKQLELKKTKDKIF